MGPSKLDIFYRRLIPTKFFSRGWGNPRDIRSVLELHKKISDRAECSELVSPLHRVAIDAVRRERGHSVVSGSFRSPLADILPKILPEVSETARFQMVVPGSPKGPAIIHMAGTGDHGFARRRELLAKPLLNHGIASVLLENPFYGSRKPKEQFRSGLLHVNDIFIMGTSLILESQALLHWLTRSGFGPLGVTGISMGGHMAALAATNWPRRIAVVPCLSWSSASIVFTEGVLSNSVHWEGLESEYRRDPAYEREIGVMLERVDCHHLGQSFVDESGDFVTFETIREKNRRDIRSSSDGKGEKKRRRQKETVSFMKGLMDEVTHLGNYSRPVDPTLVTFVVARDDAYFPPSKLTPVQRLWPGCQVRELDTGHIAGYLVYYNSFVRAIVDTFERFGHQEARKGGVVRQSLQENSVSLFNSLRAFTLKA